MNSSRSDPRATRIWFDKDDLWLELVDGGQLSVPFAYFPRSFKHRLNNGNGPK